MAPTTKRERGSAKGAVTTVINRLKALITESDLKRIDNELRALDEAVENFKAAHESYHSTLEDDDDIDSSTVYLTPSR